MSLAAQRGYSGSASNGFGHPSKSSHSGNSHPRRPALDHSRYLSFLSRRVPRSVSAGTLPLALVSRFEGGAGGPAFRRLAGVLQVGPLGPLMLGVREPESVALGRAGLLGACSETHDGALNICREKNPPAGCPD